MPRATLVVEAITAKGTEVTAKGVAIGEDGLEFHNDGAVRLLLINPGSNSCTVVVKTPLKMDGDLDVEEREYALEDGEMVLAGPFNRAVYNQPNGTVEIDAKDVDSRAIKAVAFI